jgi:hypothetical protein
MKMTKLMSWCLGLWILLTGYPAQAEKETIGDGYYCLGKGYIAYQLVDDDIYSGSKHHTLHIVYLDNRLATDAVVLSLFQVHGMLCSDNKVLLYAEDKLFSVAIRNSIRPAQLLDTRPVPNGQSLGAVVNRLYWDHAPTNESIVLHSTTSKFVFELWFTYKSRVMLQENQRVIYHQNMAEIVKVDNEGTIQERQLIFDKTLEEPIQHVSRLMM